jgi:hypothetical protein
VDILHKLVTEEIVPALPETSPVLTSEERFCSIGLRNKKLHATAKLFIMEILGQVRDPSNQQARINPKLTSTTDLFDRLCKRLEDQDPNLKDKMYVLEEDREEGAITSDL